MDLLRIGQKLGIFFQKEENLVEIDCTIAGIYDDRLVIELPQYFMRYIEYLEEGKTLTVKVFSKVGTLDFNTVIISSPLEDEFSVELDYNAMRLTPAEDMPVVKSIETINIRKSDSLSAAKTFEISTEYLKFYSDKEFKTEDVIDCELLLPKRFGIISFKGTITEVDPVYDNEYTVAYSTMTEESKQNLLYYMYVYEFDADREEL